MDPGACFGLATGALVPQERAILKSENGPFSLLRMATA